jgi:hypothetical protein
MQPFIEGSLLSEYYENRVFSDGCKIYELYKSSGAALYNSAFTKQADCNFKEELGKGFLNATKRTYTLQMQVSSCMLI